MKTWQGDKLIFAVLVVALVALHSYHFAGRAYRQDEAWSVSYTLAYDVAGVVRSQAVDIHPPLWTVLLKLWVDAFGHLEPVTRFLPSLLMCLALAVTYRLVRDLFDARTALTAIFLLATFALVMFFGHETRPYALLILAVVGTQWGFLRWLRRPQMSNALLFVGFGVFALYTHFFAIYQLAALFITFLILVRWNFSQLMRAVGLFVAIGLSMIGWLLPLLHTILVLRPGGINYALDIQDPYALRLLYNQLQMRPDTLGLLLLWVGIVIPVANRHFSSESRLRFDPQWRRWFPLLVPVLVLFTAAATNQFVANLTPRNLIIILPSLAIFLAYAVSGLPKRVQVGLLLLIAFPAVTSFRPFIANGPYLDMVRFMQPYQQGDPVITTAPFGWHHVALKYYARWRLPVEVSNDQIFTIMLPQDPEYYAIVPEPLLHLAQDDQPETLDAFRAFLDNARAERVWAMNIDADDVPFSAVFFDILRERYVPFRAGSWWESPLHTVTEYRRIPDNLRDIFTFGDDIALRGWTFRDDVNVHACQLVTLESWWQVEHTPDDNYSMTLVLTDSGGMGVTRSDGAPTGTLMQLWETNRPYLDERQLTIPCDQAPGDYSLLVGLYAPEQPDKSLTVMTPDDSPLGALAYLTTLHVVES